MATAAALASSLQLAPVSSRVARGGGSVVAGGAVFPPPGAAWPVSSVSSRSRQPRTPAVGDLDVERHPRNARQRPPDDLLDLVDDGARLRALVVGAHLHLGRARCPGPNDSITSTAKRTDGRAGSRLRE